MHGLLAIEVCPRQTANAAPDHHQVVFLASLDRLACFLPEVSVTQRVCDFESTGMTSPHSVKRWRIVAWAILRGGCKGLGREQSSNPCIGKHATRAHGHAVQEIPARDVAVHAKRAITRSTAVCILEISHIFLRTFHLFLNCTIGLVDGRIGISTGTGVGIGNRDSFKLLPRNAATARAETNPEGASMRFNSSRILRSKSENGVLMSSNLPIRY